MLLSKIDAYGKTGWIGLAAMLLWMAWPLGLLLVAFLIVSGRAQAWVDELRMPGTWFNLPSNPFTAPFTAGSWTGSRKPSGSPAFDDYRERTLRDLEDEQREFQAYLERLRKARDKAEFDAFMADRRARTQGSDTGA